ncbi:MAG: hypothetical protein P8011_17955 [Acidihalobacter sp.]
MRGNIAKLLAAILAAGFSSSVNAEGVKSFDFKIPPKSAQLRAAKTECKFEGLTVPGNTVVYAAGGYRGRDTGFQIDQSGHAARQFDVAVNSPNRPVALILASYEPTIWNMGWKQGYEDRGSAGVRLPSPGHYRSGEENPGADKYLRQPGAMRLLLYPQQP